MCYHSLQNLHKGSFKFNIIHIKKTVPEVIHSATEVNNPPDHI